MATRHERIQQIKDWMDEEILSRRDAMKAMDDELYPPKVPRRAFIGGASPLITSTASVAPLDQEAPYGGRFEEYRSGGAGQYEGYYTIEGDEIVIQHLESLRTYRIPLRLDGAGVEPAEEVDVESLEPFDPPLRATDGVGL